MDQYTIEFVVYIKENFNDNWVVWKRGYENREQARIACVELMTKKLLACNYSKIEKIFVRCKNQNEDTTGEKK